MGRPRRTGTGILPRLAGALVAVLLSPGVAAPQTGSAGDQEFPPLPRIGLPLPTLGLPLSPIGLPLAPLGLPPRTDTPPRQAPGKAHRGRRPGSRHDSRRPSVVYVVPTYPWGWPLGGGAPTSDVPGVVVNPGKDSIAGELHLDVEPAVSFQIYVDNYFVGTSNDIGTRLELDEGPHRVEVRAAGYAPHVFDTKATAGRTMTYQVTLDPLEDPQPAAEREPPAQQPPDAEPIPPTTIYFIPGCYLGNLPPDAAKLPAGCDLSRLQTYKPSGETHD